MPSPPKPSLTSGHRKRLRERFLRDPNGMADYEILELLLGYVFARKDTKPLAKTLLSKFGSLRGALDAKEASLQTIEGIGPSTETFFTLLREIFARYEEAALYEHDFISSPASIARIAQIRLGRSAHEELWGAYVDASNRVIAWRQIAVGTYNAAAVSAKDIIAVALSVKASGFILVHNHPGGTLSPSQADILLTERVDKAAQVLHLRFLDHVIITAEGSYSIVKEMFL